VGVLPDDSAKQSAMQSYVNSTSWQYPDLAAQFATTITDDHQRNNAINNIARNWLRTDPKPAAEWLNSTTLPQDQKDRLLKSATPH